MNHDPSLRRLRHMRRLATGLLVGMGAIYAASSLLIPHAPWMRAVQAFSEAAVVGACADWFAVTALFRHPFGLPLPHTAIIPHAKDRIGDALGRFIVDNFLNPRRLDAKLKALALGAWGGEWLVRPENARAVAVRLVQLGSALSRSLPAEELEGLIASVGQAAARSIPAAPAAAALLRLLWDEDRVQPIVTRVTALIASYVQTHHDVVRQMVRNQIWRWLPEFVDKAVASRITAGVVQLLLDLQDPAHPWRSELNGLVRDWRRRLEEDPELQARCEALKVQFLKQFASSNDASRIWADIARHLMVGLDKGEDELEDRVARLVGALGAWLARERSVQASINMSARAFVRRVLSPRRHEIGAYVAETVRGWDARTIVDRLEVQVGPDLQFIRINGAIIGGLVGLALYAMSRLMGLP